MSPADVGPAVEPGRRCRSRGWECSRRARIEGVARLVAEQVEGDHGQRQRRAAKGGQLPGAEQRMARVGDHAAPTRNRRLDAQAEVGERRLEQDEVCYLDK
jgi:hypothetical protein